ncbi:MAG: hypothetical protein IPL61_33495 [Myxococcales bacterium]|nr:hypothetical protein [Myxococcales bacterium]
MPPAAVETRPRPRVVLALRGVACALALLAATPAVRADEAPAPTTPALSAGRRAAAVGLAVVPGVIVPGLGTYVAREPRAARRVLATRAVGLGLMLVGGVPLAATYGSGKLIVPSVHLVTAGVGVFLGGWWADIAAAAGGRRGGPRALPAVEVGVDSTWLRDGYHGDRALVGVSGRARAGRWSAAARTAAAADGTLVVARLDGAARTWGRTTARHTGTAIDVRTALELARARDERTTTATGELAVHGRLAADLLDPALAGSFLDLDAGLGLELVDYRAGDRDLSGVLISRFAWGVYLPCARGEVAAFYDHRRDTLAGGLAAGRAAGFFGSVGVTAEVVVDGVWTVAASAEVGNAWVNTIGLRRGLP